MFPQSPTGGDKTRVSLAGRSMLDHVAERIAPQVATLVINANQAADHMLGLGLPVVPDHVPDRGPLAGLLAAMDWALQRGGSFSAVLSVSTDTPFLPENLVRNLARERPHGPAVAASQGRLHPVIGLWPLKLRDEIATALAEQRRSVEKFALRHEAIAVDFPLRTIGARMVDPFFNTNTPEDLALAEAILLGA